MGLICCGMIGKDDLAAFRCFWLFFRGDALVTDANDRCFLQRVLDGSAVYTAAVQGTPKAVVFHRVMPRLPEGFVGWRRDMDRVLAESDSSLSAIQRATLTLLYRLRFVLYAEARDLLPARHREYGRYSLTHLRTRVTEELGNRTHCSERSARLWSQLRALFYILDCGDAALGAPVYD